MNVAIIPARGGSKRIPRKNIKEFCGKPMIAWSIEAAIKSKAFNKIIISTDDEEIARIAVESGAEVPFMRPSNLSDDFVATTPVINHAINWLNENNITPDYVCCIYATAPLLDPKYIKEGIDKLVKEGCDYSFSATSYSFPIQRAIKINKTGRVEMFYPEYMDTRSQDLQESWHDAGQFYWGKTEAWLDDRPVFDSNSVPVILPRYRVQDIDTMEDWMLAESLANYLDI